MKLIFSKISETERRRERLNNLKKIIGIFIVFCLLVSFNIAQGAEVIAPVPLSDQFINKTKFKAKKKESEEKYFFCLQAQSEIGTSNLTSGIFKKKSDIEIEVVLDEIRKYGAEKYGCSKDAVVVTAFNRIE